MASPRLLIEQGFLVEPRVFTVPEASRPDLSKVGVARGDYTTRDLEQAVDRQVLVGNVVEHWQRHAAGVRTVAFAVSVAHSQHLVQRFLEAGVPAEHLDGTTPTAERDAILGAPRGGDDARGVERGVLCEGWDQPAVKCAILARPTKSTGLYLQQAGRILRPWQGHRAVILDHGGCALEHGLPQDDREFSLEGRKKRSAAGGDAPVRECPTCSAVVAIQTRVCPECGTVLFVERDVPAETNSELVEITATSRPKRSRPVGPSFFETVRRAARSGGRLSWGELAQAGGSRPETGG